MQERSQNYSTANTILLVIISIVIILLALQQYLIDKYPKDNKELIEHIELLENKIDSIKNIRDSLIIITDTTRVKIVELEKRHETIRDSIIGQSVNADCITFSEYLSKYNDRLSNNNNP